MNQNTDPSDEASIPNAEGIAYWNSDVALRWAAFQGQVDRAFAPLAAVSFATANVQTGQVVLDIGCGCGATLLHLAEAVGPDGSVVGVDVSERMLAVAEHRAVTLGLGNVRFMLADAATHAFGEAAFDLAFSRFGVMFFDDPVSAFVNVRRSLRPDGRLVFLCWRDIDANPWFHVPAQAVRPHLPAQPQPDPQAPGPLAFADPDRVRGILERAGFDRVRFDAFDVKLPLGAHPSAVELVSQIGPTSRLLADAGDNARAHATLALELALKEHEADGEVALGAGVWIVSAGNSPRR